MSRRSDYALIIVSFILIIFGLVMLASASAPVAFSKFGDSFYYLKRQLLRGFLPGLLLFLIFSRIDYRFWRKGGWLILALSLALLVSVFIPGLGADFGKARSWIRLGPITLQPAEIVKLTFLVFLAFYLEKIRNWEYPWWWRLLTFLFLSGLVAGLILLQGDLGTAIIIFAAAVTVYFISGAKLRELGVIAVLGGAAFITMIKIAPYRLARVLTFINPGLDPQGIGYQINQALLALGSGGLLGRGFGSSRQKYQYLPEVTADSIFAIIGEELGFVISVVLLFLFFSFAMRAVAISRRAPDAFGRYLATGIASWIVIQTIVNVGGIIGIMPLTGLPLPFISYGGTSLASTLAALGVLVNISKHRR